MGFRKFRVWALGFGAQGLKLGIRHLCRVAVVHFSSGGGVLGWKVRS